jgi:lipoprotein NlpI
MQSIGEIEAAAEVFCAEGKRLIKECRYKEAFRAFEQALDLKAGYAEAFFGRGVCHYKLGRYQLATSDMDAATLLGYETAQLWSQFDRNYRKDDDM